MKFYSEKLTSLTKDSPDVMSVREIAELFGLSVKTIYSWIYNKCLPILPLSGPVRIAKQDFLRWIEIYGKK